ncbi:MAG TPA: hypothetical protein VF549_01260 [Solirubrobacteraceae bacterium]
MARAAGRRPSLELLLILAAALLSGATVWWGLGPHDEGLMLQAARRIGDGQWPYRDFWWNYGPGQPLLLAPFGGSLVAWRVVRLVLNVIVAWLAYRLTRQAVLVDPRYSRVRQDGLSAAAGLTVALAMAWPATPGPNPAALALGLAAILIAQKRPVAGGALAGIATLFRPEIGIAAAIGAGRKALAVACGVAVVVWLPFFLVAPGDLLDQTVGFLGIQDLQRLPFPLDADTTDPNKLLEFYAPLILVAATAVAALTKPPLALIPLTLTSLLYLLGRTDEFHLIPLAAVLPIVLVQAQRVRALALAIVALIALHGADRIATLDRSEPAWGDHEAEVIRAIGDRTLFVAPPRFDRVTAGDPLLYVLAGKDNPTRYDVMQPGVVTTREVQEEIRDDLERAKPQVLVRWLDPRTAPEDNGSGRSSGVTLLDDYLRSTYRRMARFGVYEVHERKGP